MKSMVELRELSMQDLDSIMCWVNDPEVVGKFEWFNGHTSKEQEANQLERIIANPDKIYSVFDNGEYVGQVGLHEIADNAARMSIVLPKKAWGRGIGYQAITAVTCKAFYDLGLTTVWATPRKENSKMLHLTEKCGYTKEAEMPNAYHFHDKVYDLVKVVAHKEGYACA